ncbi:hypothetical protein [Williamsia muralis]|nr:hypothetical protein [Williamsia muralis]
MMTRRIFSSVAGWIEIPEDNTGRWDGTHAPANTPESDDYPKDHPK